MKKEAKKETAEDVFNGFSYMDTTSLAKVENVDDDELSDEEIKALEDAAQGIIPENEDEDADADDKTEDKVVKKVEKKVEKKKVVAEEEEEEDNTEDSSEEEEEESGEENGITGFAKYMNSKGLLAFDEDEKVETEEDLERVLSKTVQAEVDRYKDSVGEDGKNFLKFIEDGGNPSDFMKYYYNDATFSDFSIEEESAQKYVIRESLRVEGYSEDEIDDEIELYEDGNKLEARSKTHLNKLKKLEAEQKRALLVAQESAAKEYRKKVEDSWTNLKKGLYEPQEIAGFTFTKKMKDELWDYMSKPVDRKTNKTAYQLDEAESADARYIYAYLMKNKWDIKSLSRQVEKKVVGKLNKTLGSYTEAGKKNKSPKNTFQKESSPSFTGFKDL